jgi:hypothetical protein
MKNTINSSFIIVLMALLSCNSKKEICRIANFQDVNLYPVDVILRMPPYRILDSMRFDTQTLLNYKIITIDTALESYILIKSYVNNPEALPDIEHVISSQKHEVEFGRDSAKLLTETFRNIDSTKIGYLKYLVTQPQEKFYEGRIFFFRGKKLITLWLFEKKTNTKKDKQSVIDCILENIQLK